MTLNAANSGSFKIAGDLEVHRLGYGAMRITGEGIWGEPRDRAECLRTLKRLPELGINFIDTANSYGPDVSEQLIREALHPYKGLLIATKAGLERPGPNNWTLNGRPDYLIDETHKASRNLASNRYRYGNYIGSIRKCLPPNSSMRSNFSWTIN